MMIGSLTVGEQGAYRSTGFGLAVPNGTREPGSLLQIAHSAVKDQVQFSSAAQTAMQYQVQELEFSGGWMEMGFDAEGEVTAKASYNVNIAQKLESLQLSFTFKAETLGFSKADFAAFGGKPIQLKFDLFQQSIDYVKEYKLNISRKNRTAEEIITDIARSLRDVFLQKGDETVKLHLDTEAFQTLVGNAQTSNLVDDIAALIGIINHLRLYGGPRNQYDIYVSGKGKPQINYEEKVDLKIEGSQISLSITILPPEEVHTGEESNPDPTEMGSQSDTVVP